ncbi:hypothetical protein K470DRAFT_257072 [Piedraia hortae CBS 480.64]|uniref:Saccharopine dehydrogenase NADP binding domain-containing protein n=1 Tax=Piedraia hortae CBS 480.64 TaxID=1314780 RepID=A0A6A7C379_9PEZI|nr:hypothetical protein K470DRAFT_257072 [Piedraia hortae CBS 480.64]
MAQSHREYECIVFGATGYTGKYTCEHITTSLPTDFKWAVAGRSATKLENVVAEMRQLNPNRPNPAIEVCQLKKDELVRLAMKTKVLISTVGPYHLYGTAVLEACAETGTHYLDVTGETPWVYEMIQKYHAKAQSTGAIIIPENGVESAPTDLLCWSVVTYIRQNLGVGTKEIVQCTYDLKATPSGGTMITLLTLFDSYSLAQLAKSMNPWSLCPVQPSTGHYPKPLKEKITGVREVADLGMLTDSIQGPSDIPIVHRSWGLYGGGKLYGPQFHVTAYQKTRNMLQGIAIHLAMTFGFLALMLPPVRCLLKKFVYEPGQGPTKEQAKHEYAEWRCIGYPDEIGSPRVWGRMRFDGSMYKLTGITSAEAALLIARGKTFAHELGGGVLTPATLGATYLEQLQKAGIKVEVRALP